MNLGARYWRFSSKVAWIAAAFRNASVVPVATCMHPHLLSREGATIQLQDQWNAFCRDLIISSWRGNVFTLSGTYLAHRAGPTSESAALAAL